MPTLLKAKGLYTYRNELQNTEGYMDVADNIIIDEDGVVESRRGFKSYGNTLPLISDRAKQLLTYKGRILRHFNDLLQFDDGTGNFTSFAGSYNELVDGLRIKAQEVNGNLYFTASDGIMKISASSASALTSTSGYIKKAGIAKALDINGNITGTEGFLPTQSKTAYRLLWGRKDANSLINIGAPSSQVIIENGNSDVQEEWDFNFLASAITSDYVLLSTVNKEYYVWFVTDPQTAETVGRTGYEANTGTAAIAASSFANVVGSILEDGSPAFTVEMISATQVKVTAVVGGLVVSAFAVGTGGSNIATVGALIVGASGDLEAVEITSQIPVDINSTEYFYQLYRSAYVTVTPGITTLSEIFPDDEMNLVYEAQLTNADLTAGEITIVDETPEVFRNSSVLLYSNAISGEGILQANSQPPVANDLALFRDSLFYANTRTKHNMSINLLSASDLDTYGITLINSTGTKRTYTFTETGPEQVTIAGGDIKVETALSPSQNLDSTARSLVRIINKDASSPVYAYYISTSSTIPGSMYFESKTLDNVEFFVTSTNAAINNKFNPELIQTSVAAAHTAASNTVVTIGTHEYQVGQFVLVNNSVEIPTSTYKIVAISATTVTLDVSAANAGTLDLYSTKVNSDNEINPNRIFFSKFGLPEAVPTVNYVDIGPKDKQILRIIALRDSLFVFKEDGVYIITGTSAPNFSSRLLDNSTILIAPDSAVVLSNRIYCLTSQGVVTVTDGGVSIISRPIEDLISKVTTFKFSHSTASFGLSSESDRSYMLWLPTRSSDTVATQVYRYNTFTDTWTRWVKSSTCGVINSTDDKIYLGSAEFNDLEQERKEKDRTDYADREYSVAFNNPPLSGTTLFLSTVANIAKGDTIHQLQYVTLAQVNRLLKKLDKDPYLALSAANAGAGYVNTVGLMVAGESLQQKLIAVNAALVSDANIGTYTPVTFSNDFETMQSEFNDIIDQLNSSLVNTFYKSYSQSTSTTYYEAVILDKSTQFNSVVTNVELPWIFGAVDLLTIYKGIRSEVIYSPQHFGNPELLKQISEATMIFDQNNFYSAEISFRSDLSRNFDEIEFFGTGWGIFGFSTYGDDVWGGEGNDAPLRTFVPMEKQRCRYLTVRFVHINARDPYKLVGISAEPRVTSTRAYK